ncbi:MAG: BamA/TamA family outer membrane protein [candidate division Zixibacteria bacterium]
MRSRFRYMIVTLLVFTASLTLGYTITQAQSLSKEDRLFQSWLADNPYISDIIVDGNQFFSDSKIRSKLFSRKNTFWQALKSGSRNRILRYTINRDTLEIKYLYYREGYLNVGVDESIEMNTSDSGAIIHININEGNRFIVGRVNFQANDSLTFFGELRNIANRFRTGNPVDPIKLNEMVFDLKTGFANNGYPYAIIETAVDSSAGPQNTNISITANEGHLVRFGDVLFDNLYYYSSDLAAREIAFKKGEIYSREKILESQKRLYSTGLFNSISLDFVQQLPDSQRAVDSLNPDFRFSAVERKSHYITVKTGASQDSLRDLTWDFSAAWGKRNIFKSRRFEFSITSRFVIFTDWRVILHRYQTRFTEPRFLGLRLPLTLTARFEPGVRSQLQPYRVQTWLLALSTRKEWSEQLFAVISGEYESVNIYGVSKDQVGAIRREENISIRRKLTFILVRDTRLDKFVPKQGSFTTYYAQYVGGILSGDDSFLKLEFSWARYQRAIGSFIYATRIKGGWVKEMGKSTEVPTNDRFYLGGANTIRGFRENIIGPRIDHEDYQFEDSTNIGANSYLIFNQEMRFPILGKFWGSVFADIGNGWGSFSDFDPDDLLFAYGTGFQYLSPAGPLRLDYAHRLGNGVYAEDSRWHITILYAF